MPTEPIVETPPPATPPATPPPSAPPTAIVPPASTPPATPPVTPPPAAPEGSVPHVPEAYTLTLPEKSPLTGADLDRFRGEVKALGLTQEQAQKYVDTQNGAIVVALKQLDQEGADLKADPDLGGAKYETTLRQVSRGLKEFFGPDEADARGFIDRLALGNNKVLVRAFARFGAKFSEDSAVQPGSGSPTQEKTLAERLYGTPPPA